jgi:hypothetical protein
LFSIIIAEVPIVFNKLSKLMPKQCILNVIVYMKDDNITTHMMFACGTNKFFFGDDALFIA